MLSSFAVPAVAQDYPKLKPGLWEMERSSDRAPAANSAPGKAGQGAFNRMTMCLDDSVQREMIGMGAGAMQGMCSRHDFRMSGNRGSGDFICDMGGSRMHSRSTLVMQGNSAYRAEINTTYDPPLMGQAKTTAIITARRVGACAAGQQPGDILMPNGQTLNMRDMMSGKGTIAPPPRAR